MHTKVEARLDTAPPGHPVRTVSLPAAVARPLGPPFRGLPRCRTRRPGRRAPRRHTDRRRRALRATRGRACGLWPRTCRRTAAAAAVALGCGLRPGRRRWCRPCWPHEVERNRCLEDGLAPRGCARPTTARGRGRAAWHPIHVVVVVVVEHVHRSVRGPLGHTERGARWHVILGAAPTEARTAGGRVAAGLDHVRH